MNGILLVDKESGWTSNDVIAKLRGILHERRIGHSGTLDPLATGLLVVFVGRATRAVEFASEHDKRYIAGLRLGVTTDTQDISGTVIKQCEQSIDEGQLKAVLTKFSGEIAQIPPMYSAIKINGQRLYEIARRGSEVERQARAIKVYEISVIGRENDDFCLDISCSKGSYVRTLCNDIGEALQCGGCMSSLRRIKAGGFDVKDAVKITEIKKLADAGTVGEHMIPVDRLFEEYPKCTVDSAAERSLRCGTAVEALNHDGTYRVYSSSGEFLLLGKVKDGMLHTIKSFFEV